jgi:glycosyltransferase involved in cell wall biosynthesis
MAAFLAQPVASATGTPTAERSTPGRPRLLVVHPGAELYGADRVLLESATALATRFDVTVALPGPGPLVGALQERGLPVVQCRMPVLRRAAFRPRGALQLLSDAVLGALPALRLLHQHPAGVYVNTLTLPSWPLLARLANRPSVCHVHEAERSQPRLLRRAMAVCPALADRVIANSRFTLDVLTEVAPRLRARTAVVHNGIAAPGPALPARARLDGPLRLLFVGRLSPRKGPQVAVATLQELLARGVDARLQLLGSVFEGYEWFEAELRQTVDAARLGDRVDFLGFRPDVWPRLTAADVVLVPSVGDESFGNTAVEAVLAARPLVVSDASGLREAAAGYRSAQPVAVGRAADWADAVQRVTAGWATFRGLAWDDAAEARRRHAPRLHQERLVEAVAGIARGTAGLDARPVRREEAAGRPVLAGPAPVG